MSVDDDDVRNQWPVIILAIIGVAMTSMMFVVPEVTALIGTLLVWLTVIHGIKRDL